VPYERACFGEPGTRTGETLRNRAGGGTGSLSARSWSPPTGERNTGSGERWEDEDEIEREGREREVYGR